MVPIEQRLDSHTFLAIAFGELWPKRHACHRVLHRPLDPSTKHEERANQALALKVLADATAHGDAVDAVSAAGHYTKSLALANELGMRPLVAHCHAGLGKLYRRTGKRRESDQHFAMATTMYREVGMAYWLEQAERSMKDMP